MLLSIRKTEGVTGRDRVRNTEVYRHLKCTQTSCQRIHQRRLRYCGHTLRMSSDRYPRMIADGHVFMDSAKEVDSRIDRCNQEDCREMNKTEPRASGSCCCALLCAWRHQSINSHLLQYFNCDHFVYCYVALHYCR